MKALYEVAFPKVQWRNAGAPIEKKQCQEFSRNYGGGFSIDNLIRDGKS